MSTKQHRAVVPRCTGSCINRVSRFSFWSIPAPARRFLLLVETAAVTLTIMALVTQPVAVTDLVRVAVLGGLAIGYAECAARIERLKRYLGGGTKVFNDQLGVWTFAAALTVPAGWAAVMVVLVYTQVLIQRHREKSGPPYRVVFTAAAVMLSVLAASATLGGTGGEELLGGFFGPLAVVLALGVFTVVNFGLMVAAMWLTARPPSVRAVLPDRDGLGYELATLVLGIFAAEFVLRVPALVPLVLVLAAYLHRGSLVHALRHAARMDAKTGLLNATAWTDQAEGVLSRSSRDHTPVTVLFCDLDRFKTVNDAHGHLVGDHVLAAVASCLRRELRGHDGIGRFGGEEFVVILDGLNLPDAQAIANRLRSAISALHFDPALHITMSIGLAHHEPRADRASLQALLGHADAALAQAKVAGRDCVQVA